MYLFQNFEMRIFGYNVIRIGCNGAVYEFIIIFVHICQQTKTIIGFPIMSLRMPKWLPPHFELLRAMCG